MDGQRYRVLISDKARQMMKAHVSFLAEVNPQAAEKLRVSLMEGIRSLAQMPERCPYLDEEDRRSPYRKLHIPKWYLVIYVVVDDTVYVEYIVDVRQEYGWLLDKKVKNQMKKTAFFRPSFVCGGGNHLDDNWIVENLENALATWNEKLAEIWQLVSMTPQEFKGGGIWNIVVQINGALQAIGYGLLVLFFAMGLFKNTVNFQELRRPEAALRYFLHFVAAKAAVTYCMPLMLAVFDICGGIVSTVAGQMGGMAGNVGTLPGEISAAIGNVGFLASIPLWLVTILGSLFITVLSFILIMTVYSRFFKLYLYTALALVPIAAFGSGETAATGKAFLKGYVGVCLEGAVIVLSCLIFSAYMGSGSPVVPSGSAVSMV